jgi:pimeloyl-ACP methyl ester carboxylesterase
MDQVTEEVFMLPVVRYRTADVDGFKVFYRKAGPADAPKLLLLHGFPSAMTTARQPASGSPCAIPSG